MKTIQTERGFSLIELLVAMTVMLILLASVSTILSGALSIRSRESSKTDALSASQAALNVISREVANSGYGLNYNGIIAADSGDKKIRVRANLKNSNNCVNDPGEDVSYFYDTTSQSIVRTERFSSTECGATIQSKTSVVVNRISNITFQYFDYTATNRTGSQTSVPTVNTGRVVITVEVKLDDVRGQPSNQTVTLKSDVTLRNSEYMLDQY